MKLKILGSSSKGNCYILETESEALILEAGLPISEVKQALNFEVKKIKGLLITHEHGDHAKFIRDYGHAGIPVFSAKKTFEALKIDVEFSPLAKPIDELTTYQIGNFKIMGFSVNHDAADPYGYLIEHPEAGRILFITDCNHMKYRFKDIQHFLIEANYSFDLIKTSAIRDRIFRSHMELSTTKGILKDCGTSETNNIILIHLSDSNSDANLFKAEIELSTGVPTEVADRGVVVDLNKSDF